MIASLWGLPVTQYLPISLKIFFLKYDQDAMKQTRPCSQQLTFPACHQDKGRDWVIWHENRSLTHSLSHPPTLIMATMQRGSEREIYLKIMAVILFAADSRTDQLFYPNLSNHPDWDPSAQTLICPPRNALCLLSWHFEDYLQQPRLLPVVYLAPKIVGTMCSVYCEWIYPEQRCREEDPDPGIELIWFTCNKMWGVTSYH